MNIVKAQERDLKDKAKRLRKAGIVPGVVFGGALPESIPIQMDHRVAGKLLREKNEGSKLTLGIGEKTFTVQIKDFDQDLVTREVRHINFQVLEEGKKVRSVITVHLLNRELVNGITEQMLHEIPYTSLPEDMVDVITLDLAGMKPGMSFAVNELEEARSGKIVLDIDPEHLIYKIEERISPTES